MVMKMQIPDHNSNIMEIVTEEFNGQYFYGLELILDELFDKKKNISKKDNTEKVDWFGLSDLSI